MSFPNHGRTFSPPIWFVPVSVWDHFQRLPDRMSYVVPLAFPFLYLVWLQAELGFHLLFTQLPPVRRSSLRGSVFPARGLLLAKQGLIRSCSHPSRCKLPSLPLDQLHCGRWAWWTPFFQEEEYSVCLLNLWFTWGGGYFS